MVKKTIEEQIENLAQMVQRGFEETAAAKDMKEFSDRVENRFEAIENRLDMLERDVESGFSAVANILKSIQEDIKELKGLEVEVTSLRLRLERVEKHLGLSN